MTHDISLKRKARTFRRKGYSIPAISNKLSIAKSTVSLWVRNVKLPEDLANQLKHNFKYAHKKGRGIRIAKLNLELISITKDARKDISKLDILNSNARILAALLYWCEGAKQRPSSGIRFTNSDPDMIQTFLRLFRRGFAPQESKFRALIHLHDYHDEQSQLQFWSSITGIPIAQFYASYRKANTGKIKRENYPGCITIHYSEARVAKNIKILYTLFAQKYGKA